MGIGDEIMMGGEARRRAAGTARRYRMLDKRGQPRWHFVWEGNPHVARPGQPFDGEIGYVDGRRPYLAEVRPDRYRFREYQPAPGILDLSGRDPAASALAEGAVVFNPCIKPRAPVNKAWPRAAWEALVAARPGIRWVQLCQPGDAVIAGAVALETPHFLDAALAIRRAACLICHEGALHHAAAAVGTPAIVIRGGFISPRVTGYDGQVDFYVEHREHPLGCGWRVPCRHCRDAMASITPDNVGHALMETLKK